MKDKSCLPLITLLFLFLGGAEASAQGFCAATDYDCQIADYTKKISANPKDGDSYTYRGFVYAKKGDCERAIPDLTRSLELRPEATTEKWLLAKTYDRRGLCYEDVKNEAKALADFNKAIEFDPTVAAFYLNRSFFHWWRLENSLALADAEKAIQLDPKDPRAYDLRANAQTDQTLALADRDKYISMIDSTSPLMPRALAARASTYQAMRKFDLALKDLNAAIALAPTQRSLYTSRAILYIGMGRNDLAAADNKKAESLPK